MYASDAGSTTARSVDEIALIRDTINHYGPVFIASLSIHFVAPASRKNSAVGLVGVAGRQCFGTLPKAAVPVASGSNPLADLEQRIRSATGGTDPAAARDAAVGAVRALVTGDPTRTSNPWFSSPNLEPRRLEEQGKKRRHSAPWPLHRSRSPGLHEAAAGFQSRLGFGRPAPVTPDNALFATYKAAGVHHAAWRRNAIPQTSIGR